VSERKSDIGIRIAHTIDRGYDMQRIVYEKNALSLLLREKALLEHIKRVKRKLDDEVSRLMKYKDHRSPRDQSARD
jgi:hypothetical protein